MADQATPPTLSDLLAPLLALPGEFSRRIAAVAPGDEAALPLDPAAAAKWATTFARLQSMWLDFQREQALRQADPAKQALDPAWWLNLARNWQARIPLANPELQQRLFDDGMAIWQAAIAPPGLGTDAATGGLPRQDRRFADREWIELRVLAGFEAVRSRHAGRVGCRAKIWRPWLPGRRHRN